MCLFMSHLVFVYVVKEIIREKFNDHHCLISSICHRQNTIEDCRYFVQSIGLYGYQSYFLIDISIDYLSESDVIVDEEQETEMNEIKEY